MATLKQALCMGVAAAAGFVGVAAISGCRDSSPNVPNVPAPAPGQDTERREYEPNKPMPRDQVNR